MRAADWIDRLKAERGWDSDYRVAKELDVAGSTLSRYRNKPESTMDDETALKVADALRVEPEIILVDQVAERTRSEPAKAALGRLLQRLRSGGGGATVDITNVTHGAGEGEKRARRSREYSLCQSKPSPLQLLARAFWPAAPTALA